MVIALFVLVGFLVGVLIAVTYTARKNLSVIDKLEDDRIHRIYATQRAVVPLVWALDHLDPANLKRQRLYVLDALKYFQEALGFNDLEMADGIQMARTTPQPRTLPKYPMVPTWIANPEDVAKVDQAIREVSLVDRMDGRARPLNSTPSDNDPATAAYQRGQAIADEEAAARVSEQIQQARDDLHDFGIVRPIGLDVDWDDRPPGL